MLAAMAWQLGWPGQGVGQSLLVEPLRCGPLHYRGLWGLYTRDPFAQNAALAGLVYNWMGLMRRSWYRPSSWLGFGLDKLPLLQPHLNLCFGTVGRGRSQ